MQCTVLCTVQVTVWVTVWTLFHGHYSQGFEEKKKYKIFENFLVGDLIYKIFI